MTRRTRLLLALGTLPLALVLSQGCVGEPDRVFFDDTADGSSSTTTGLDGGSPDSSNNNGDGGNVGPDGASGDASSGADADSEGGNAGGVYTVGGLISGLAGSGLVLTNNGVDDLFVTQDGAFQFATKADTGDSYDVGVKTQPSNPTQICSVANASGTMGTSNVTVFISCTTQKFKVGGAVAGMKAGTSVVLQNNLGDNITVDSNKAFEFPTTVSSGQGYSVTVLTQPTDQTCTVTAGSGTMGAAAVTNVAVTCAPTTYTIGGTAIGVANGGLQLTNAANGEVLSITSSGAFAFVGKFEKNATYNVSITSSAAGEICTLDNASGTVGTSNVTSLAVTCMYREDFDTGVTLPGFPAGWTAASTCSEVWATNNAVPDTAPNYAFLFNMNSVCDRTLTKTFAIEAANAKLTFRHYYYHTYANDDGAVLEIQIPGVNGNNFQDILAAGGSFVQGGYNQTLITGYENPIEGRQAWAGSTSGAYITTEVNLPAAAAGKNVSLRWRYGSNNGVAPPGNTAAWRVDTISLRP